MGVLILSASKEAPAEVFVWARLRWLGCAHVGTGDVMRCERRFFDAEVPSVD